ncbi:MAG: hypothetical protein IT384_05025 [Deltaproteobacteria bacterium]|nr:hypothetical protein [Deltaproteobacteria bacterium]
MRRSLPPLASSAFLFLACASEPSGLPSPEDAAASSADGGSHEGDAGLPRYTWWQDVQPIVAVKCQLCHASPPQFGAPRSLVTYADTQATVLTSGAPVHAEMAHRIRAPQSAMPPPNQPPLAEDEKRIIEIWSAIGAPEGAPPSTADGSVGPDGGPAADALPGQDASSAPDAAPGSDAAPATDGATSLDGGARDAGRPDSGPITTRTWDLRAHAAGDPSTPYALPVDRTNYSCWAFTVPPGSAAQEYAVSFEPLIDNTRHLHHTLIFRNRGQPEQEGPFGCGGPGPDWDMVAGWAPGRGTEHLPPGVGTRASQGDQYILQAHYDLVTAPGETDTSGVRITLSDEPGLAEAGVLWHGLSWLSAFQGSNVSRSHTCTIRTPITMFAVFPHMHKLGTRITLEIQRSGQSTWDLVGEVPAWSFDDQPNLPVPTPYQAVSPGDKLRTTCWWDTQGRSVSFGEASDDEMCFNFISHYPLLNNANYLCWGATP